MIAFWIFAILTGLSVFAWFSFTMGVVPAFFIAAATVLVMRGLASWIKRYLVLTERIADEKVVENRTLEINRYIFWRRASFLIALLALGIFLAALPACRRVWSRPGRHWSRSSS